MGGDRTFKRDAPAAQRQAGESALLCAAGADEVWPGSHFVPVFHLTVTFVAPFVVAHRRIRSVVSGSSWRSFCRPVVDELLCKRDYTKDGSH